MDLSEPEHKERRAKIAALEKHRKEKATPEEEKEAKFGFMLRAFEYGAPPHGGCAFGFDRWAMLMAGEKSIRDVIPFPKTAGGRDLMMDAPASVNPEALKDLGIRLLDS